MQHFPGISAEYLLSWWLNCLVIRQETEAWCSETPKWCWGRVAELELNSWNRKWKVHQKPLSISLPLSCTVDSSWICFFFVGRFLQNFRTWISGRLGVFEVLKSITRNCGQKSCKLQQLWLCVYSWTSGYWLLGSQRKSQFVVLPNRLWGVKKLPEKKNCRFCYSVPGVGVCAKHP